MFNVTLGHYSKIQCQYTCEFRDKFITTIQIHRMRISWKTTWTVSLTILLFVCKSIP